jgi:hypothetical protein
VLRVGIGWQLLYEGMWKINTLGTQSPWTSDGYLKSAQGPFRNFFRAMAGDPDDKSWLDADSGCSSLGHIQQTLQQSLWTQRQSEKRLTTIINGAASHDAVLDLPKLPEGVDFAALKLDKTISFDAAAKRSEDRWSATHDRV